MNPEPSIEYSDSIAESRISGPLCRVPLGIARFSEAHAVSQPVSFGVPLPRGCVRQAVFARLTNPNGVCVPVQIQPSCRWLDGSVQWALVDAWLPDEFRDQGILELFQDEPIGENNELVVKKNPLGLVIQTGSAAFSIDLKTLRPFQRVQIDDECLLASAGSRFVLKDKRGRLHEPVIHDWSVETAGPIRATVVGVGTFPRLRGMRIVARTSFFAGSGMVKLEVSLHNPRRARHRGGLWDLGDPGSILFRDFSFEIFPLAGSQPAQLRYSLEPANPLSSPLELGPRGWSVYQDSSGGDNWQSKSHLNREGRVPCQFRGYRLQTEGEETQGNRGNPTVRWQNDRTVLLLAVPEFWQQFPKAISIKQDRIRVGVFPEEWNDLHELQGGERKTHTIWMEFQSPCEIERNPSSLDWVHQPATVRPCSEACDRSRSLPRMNIPNSKPLTDLEELLKVARDGAKGILAHREAVDDYGWRNYGDIHADHEQTYYTGDLPLVSHYNNQFDMVYGFLFHYLRTGEQTWRDLGDALARHVIDIDIYHTDEDKAAYNGGLFWFTDHYRHAHTSSHRTYTRLNRPNGGEYGGGPGPEHNFTSGLLLHYCLTGNPDSRDAVLELANWVVQMDDGRQTVLSVLDDHSSGLASGSGVFHGPSRGGGNSINALLDGWRLTHDRQYLEYAESLIHRCIHPSDDIDSLQLLDVEKRWSYTIFLTSLSKYLRLKAEAGQYDDNYAYAQASLVHYAQWMLENEKAYFDQVENLEYPTEAWAAQEFRKANVLRRAARHALEPLRDALLNRGEGLANRAWKDLLQFPTRTHARAVAIMMSEGWADCEFRSVNIEPEVQLDDACDFGLPQQFVSQKVRVKRQLQTPIGLVKTGMRLLNPMRWWMMLQSRKQVRRLVP